MTETQNRSEPTTAEMIESLKSAMVNMVAVYMERIGDEYAVLGMLSDLSADWQSRLRHLNETMNQ